MIFKPKGPSAERIKAALKNASSNNEKGAPHSENTENTGDDWTGKNRRCGPDRARKPGTPYGTDIPTKRNR